MTSGPVFAAGETLPAGQLQKLGSELTSYTPSIDATTTDPTLGSPGQLQQGGWYQNGGLVHVFFNIQFGSAGAAAGSGTYRITLPVTPLDIGISDLVIGSGHLVDSSAPTLQVVVYHWVPGDGAICRITADAILNVTDTAPWTWAASDQLRGYLTYPGNF